MKIFFPLNGESTPSYHNTSFALRLRRKTTLLPLLFYFESNTEQRKKILLRRLWVVWLRDLRLEDYEYDDDDDDAGYFCEKPFYMPHRENGKSRRWERNTQNHTHFSLPPLILHTIFPFPSFLDCLCLSLLFKISHYHHHHHPLQ